MKSKKIVKLAIDIGMTIILLLLMTYALIGEEVHEWLGIGMFVLFILHHILNYKWWSHIVKGKYKAFRILQTSVVAGVLLAMLGSMISGVILSRHALDFLPIQGGMSFARKLHMISAYWGFILMSIHLGLHWNMIIGMAKNFMKKASWSLRWGLRIIALLIAGYGGYAFVKREIGRYMLLKIQFVFFDFDEPVVSFLFDYVTIMGLFVLIGHYFSKVLRCMKQNNL